MKNDFFLFRKHIFENQIKVLLLCLNFLNMKKNTYFIVKTIVAVVVLSNAAFGLWSCKNTGTGSTKSIEAISTSGNAAMINNPMSAEGVVDSNNVAQIQFDNNFYDFGKIKAGKVVTHIYKFKNAGKVPLLIKECISSCGCTVPTFKKEPIAPGESGEIEVHFDSKGKEGRIQKIVTVYANTLPNDVKIGISGDVEK